MIHGQQNIKNLVDRYVSFGGAYCRRVWFSVREETNNFFRTRSIQPIFLRLFAGTSLCQFAPLFNLRTFIFSLTHFGCLLSFSLSLISDGNVLFVLGLLYLRQLFSGKRIGRKTWAASSFIPDCTAALILRQTFRLWLITFLCWKYPYPNSLLIHLVFRKG